jgi:hypothetical protein
VGIATPTIIDTRIDATKVNLCVESFVACDSEYVVCSAIEGEVLNPVVEAVAKRVTQRE